MKRMLRGFAGSLERSDSVLLAAVLILLALGAVVVYGAGSYNSQAVSSPFGQHYILIKHLAMIVIGALLMLGLLHVDYHWFRIRWLNWTLWVTALVLVAATLVNPEGRHINRWINVFGFSLQPVELAKIAAIVFLADRLAWLEAGKCLTPRNLLVALAVGPLPLLLLLALQPNYGNVMTLAGVTVVLLFVVGVPARLLAAALSAPLAAGVLAFMVVPKLHHRLTAWLQGLLQGEYEYQVRQSLIGLGAGGWRGLGVGHSHNKFFFLPESHTDFAYSVLGEEWGLAGTLGVILLVVIIAWRGFAIASRAADPFGRLVAAGLTTGLTIYGLTNIAMVIGIFPVVGVPLPFVSFGGTAMVTGLATLGILLNIDRVSRSYRVWRRRWQRSGVAQP